MAVTLEVTVQCRLTSLFLTQSFPLLAGWVLKPELSFVLLQLPETAG